MSEWDIVEECLGECDSSRFFDRALAEHRKMRDELIRLREVEAERDMLRERGNMIGEAFQDIIAERDRLKEKIDELALGNLKAQHRAAKVNARLRKTLEWYGNLAHYYNTGRETVIDDRGRRARKELEVKNND